MFDFIANLSGKEINMIFYGILFILFLFWAIPKIRNFFRESPEEPVELKGLSNPEIYKQYFGYYPDGYVPEEEEDYEDADSEVSEEKELEHYYNQLYFPKDSAENGIIRLDFSYHPEEQKKQEKPGKVFQFPGTKNEGDS